MTTEVLEKRVNSVLQSTLVYLMANQKGFGYADINQPNKNNVTLSDLPEMIYELQDLSIIPNNGKYVDIDGDACVVYNANHSPIRSIEQSDLFVEHNRSDKHQYEGLKEKPYRQLLRSLL